jgi:signal transduction histidine kinase
MRKFQKRERLSVSKLRMQLLSWVLRGLFELKRKLLPFARKEHGPSFAKYFTQVKTNVLGRRMVKSNDDEGRKDNSIPVDQILIRLNREIIDDWEKTLRQHVPSAKKLTHPILVNTIPGWLQNLAEALKEGNPRKLAFDSTNLANEHGGERARLTSYGPDDLLQEIHILRDIIIQKLLRECHLSEEQRSVIQKSFNQAIQESMSGFFLVLSRLREQFVASLSHDLRTPIGVARMAADLIQSAATDLPDSEIKGDILSLAVRIMNNTKRADRMIQNLLDTSLLHFGEGLQLNIVECDIFSIAQEVISDLPRNQQMRIRLNGGPVWGHWDPEALRRTLENLVTNAFKYGGAETPVTIKVHAQDGRVIMSVHNLESFVPQEEREYLFQAFRRTAAAKGSGKKGWGVGLALVRAVAEAHGGSIGIDSSLESGTVFMIDIPVDARPFRMSPTTEGRRRS